MLSVFKEILILVRDKNCLELSAELVEVKAFTWYPQHRVQG